ncbi:MAG: DeoR/GlpR family DNA-binding transcription regulator [Lachnospiraceae bacterium]|nr:DeoR/GlpR family DNA-binding transcription regulator [Lachnospiraceae bacterium]
MLSEERKGEILRIVNTNKSVTVQELRSILNVSESTIRRDITLLSREGRLVKVFGGAVALDNPPNAVELSVLAKETMNRDEKRVIAEYAASLIVPDDYVYIDSGTTTEMMIEFIREKNATYVTNAVSHAKGLVRRGLKVLLIGGELKENTEAIVGADAILHIQKYHFSKGFFGTNGVNMKLGFTTPDVREALIKRVAIQNTQPGSRFILADHDKFGQSSAVTFSDFGGTVTITDKYPGEIYSKAMELKIITK